MDIKFNLSGQRFGKLTILERAPNRGKRVAWSCQCDCGNISQVQTEHLRGGHTKSCGCAHREAAGKLFRTHGRSHTQEYNIWCKMRDRCENPKVINYHLYGGRGIAVCERWLSFEHFFSDMGIKPEGTSLDRYPNQSGNYEPGNCRWATWTQQNNNRRNNHLETYEGLTLTLAEWSRRTSINRQTISMRLALGWSICKALTTPVGAIKRGGAAA